MSDQYGHLTREELLDTVQHQRAKIDRHRATLDAYEMGLHQLYGALCTVMNRARSAIRHGEPIDVVDLLAFAEGRYHEVGDGVARRVKEVEKR